MIRQGLFAAISSIVITMSVLLPVSGAFAGEGIDQIGQDKARRQHVVNYLNSRYVRHQKFIDDEAAAAKKEKRSVNDAAVVAKIIADLETESQKNIDHLNSLGRFDDANGLRAAVAQQAKDYQKLNASDVIMIDELKYTQGLYQSDNYMFYMMNNLSVQISYAICQCQDPAVALPFAILLVPFDIVFLPIEFLITAITGF